MSHNLKLVKYFTNEFYFDHTIDLAHIASNSFKYSVNSGPTKNFEEYAKRRSLFNQNARLTIGTFSSEDDMYFYADFNTELTNGERISGECMLRVSRGLLEQVDINYDLSGDELLDLERVLLKEN